jgi:hypothetical protein
VNKDSDENRNLNPNSDGGVVGRPPPVSTDPESCDQQNLTNSLHAQEVDPGVGVAGRRSRKGPGSRIRSGVFASLIVLYFISIVALGYWYFMRPVRAEQITGAYDWWRAIAVIYHVPVPPDQRYE